MSGGGKGRQIRAEELPRDVRLGRISAGQLVQEYFVYLTNSDSFGHKALFHSVPGSIATDIPRGGYISSAKPNQPTQRHGGNGKPMSE